MSGYETTVGNSKLAIALMEVMKNNIRKQTNVLSHINKYFVVLKFVNKIKDEPVKKFLFNTLRETFKNTIFTKVTIDAKEYETEKIVKQLMNEIVNSKINDLCKINIVTNNKREKRMINKVNKFLKYRRDENS